MATLFALSDGDISTIGSLNSADNIFNSGTIGSVLSANKPLATATTYTTLNNPVYGISLCLSSVGAINPTDTITIRLSTTNYVYAASGLSSGIYTNKFINVAPQSMVGWILFKLPAPVSYSAAPPLSVFGPNSVRLLGSNATGPASMLVYGPYNKQANISDTLYLTKSLRTNFTTENRTVNGSFSALATVYLCDGVKSSNYFYISGFNANVDIAQRYSLYISYGGIFSGTAILTGLNVAQYIHVLDGGVLSANYTLPTSISRVKATGAAIVDLSNAKFVNGENTKTWPFSGEYLHDITTGYAKFNNCTFYDGISCGHKNTNVSNLTAQNCVSRTYTYQLFVGVNNKLNNVLFNNLSANASTIKGNISDFLISNSNFYYLTLDGTFSNLTANNIKIDEKIIFSNSNFINSKISNISFDYLYRSDSSAIYLNNNNSLPDFENILIKKGTCGIEKNDDSFLKINGLSCLSCYNCAISSSNLNGELNNVLLSNGRYGNGDMYFKTHDAPLVINGLTAIRTSVDPITVPTSIGTSIRSLCGPYPGFSSLLMNDLSSSVTTKDPFEIKLTHNDDFTMEIWYNPIDAKLPDQSLMRLHSIYSPISCTIGLSLTNGFIKAIATPKTGGTAFTILSTGIPYELQNNKWYHIALTKESNIYTIYLNGERAATAINTKDLDGVFENLGGYKVYIGSIPFDKINSIIYSQNLVGYVAGAKISYGSIYNSEFTPLSTPFITDAGTFFNLTTSFSAQYSTIPRVFLNIQNNKSNASILFNNLNFLSNKPLSSSLIDISNSSYESFSIINSNLHTYATPLVTNSNKDYIFGSYIFDKCNFIKPLVDANIIQSYQPYTYRESGFAFQCVNGDPNNNFRWTRGGKVSLDASITYNSKFTEKLESISDEFILKSNLKLIPVSPESLVNGIKLTYKTPISYLSGASLKIEKNTILGINEDITLCQLAPTNNIFTTINISLSDYNSPSWAQKSYIGAFVELIGINNQLHIGKWQLSTI